MFVLLHCMVKDRFPIMIEISSSVPMIYAASTGGV